jgi:hypothetical protein
MTVEKFPGRFNRHRQISGKEMWSSHKPSDFMVWEVCPYIRSTLERCNECPEWEYDEEVGSKVQRSCYGLAAEACRIVMAVQTKENKDK